MRSPMSTRVRRPASSASYGGSRSVSCFAVAAWNYPYLIAVNSVIPAIMAGNAVVLKHSAQTPLCAERFAECLRAAGLPEGVFQFLHMSHEDTERVVGDERVVVRCIHRLGGRRAGDSTCRGVPLRRERASSLVVVIRRTCVMMRTSHMPSRTSWTGRSSTAASPVAASSESTYTSASTMSLSAALSN